MWTSSSSRLPVLLQSEIFAARADSVGQVGNLRPAFQAGPLPFLLRLCCCVGQAPGLRRPPRPPLSTISKRGGALLTVLWVSAALSAIAFSVATTVRGETERASILAEATRGHYIATGAIERALMHVMSKPPALPRSRFDFPGGAAIVEAVPEASKLSLNYGQPGEFAALLLALGVEPMRAQEIAAAIVDWRGPGGAFDGFYSTLVPSFRARHASFEETEEVLFVKGMTPEIFHGNYVRGRQGRLVRTGAFKDCVSVYGATGRFDVNFAEPALLVSLGMPPEAAAKIVELRRAQPIREVAAVASLAGPAMAKLGAGGNTMFTFRSTARARIADGRLSDVSRTAAALVKFRKYGENPPYQILRWEENAWSEVSQWQ